jgi:flagellar biosynthesis chaperone FliJ
MAIKTKFDQVVKLKKLKVEEVENELLSLNQHIDSEQQKLISLNVELSNIKYPHSGDFSQMLQLREMMKIEISQINQVKKTIEDLNNQKSLINEHLKEVKLDYEKIKFLQGEEIKKELKNRVHKEAKDMDEIAIMLYKDKG